MQFAVLWQDWEDSAVQLAVVMLSRLSRGSREARLSARLDAHSPASEREVMSLPA